MKKVALVVDNSAALTEEEVKKLGIVKIVPISFIINGEEYFENENMSYTQFYDFLEDKTLNISTSQPGIGIVEETWREVLKTYDEIIYIILSSSLSASYTSAEMLSHQEEFEGKVFVANNQRVSYMNKLAMYQAAYLIKQDKSAKEIKEYLEETKGEFAAFIAVDTLKYLKKGGRITPAAAAIGTLLNIKPILQLGNGKLDSFAKVMSMKQAKSKIISVIRKDCEERFKTELMQGKVYFSVLHTNPDVNANELIELKHEAAEAFPDMKFFTLDPLPLFVACHTGPKSIAMGYVVDKLGAVEYFNKNV